MSELPLSAASHRLRGRPGRPRTHGPVGHGPRHGARQVPVPSALVERPLNRQSSDGRLLGLKEAAAYLGISDWTLRKLMAERHLAPVRLPGVCRLLFDRTDLDRLIERSRLP